MAKKIVRKVTKQLPADAFSDAAKKLLYTKLPIRAGAPTDSQ